MIVCSEFTAWSKSYDGPKFHAVLCDPPYGLEFMGKEWDAPHKATSFPKAGNIGGFADGNKPSFARQGKHLARLSEVFCAWGEAMIPLLYPGALVFMFGGTRTWHRLAIGMEDAGFQMWDTINHCSVYDPGWQSGWLEWYYGSGFPKAQEIANGFCQCSEVSNVNKVYVPSVQVDILDAEKSSIPSEENGPNVQPEMYGNPVPRDTAPKAKTPDESKGYVSRKMPRMPKSCMDSELLEASERADLLFAPMCGEIEGTSTGPSFPQGKECLDGKESGVLSEENDRAKKPGMEGRGDLFSKTRELQTSQVCSVPSRISADGEEGRVRNGAPSSNGQIDRPPSDASGGCPSRRPQPSTQRSVQSPSVAGQSNAQIMGARICSSCGKLRATESMLLSWRGYKTAAMKPAHEPILCFKAPSQGRTYADLAMEFGSGCLNVDGGRIGDFKNEIPSGMDRYNQMDYEQGYRPSPYQKTREGEASRDRRYTESGSTNFAAKPGPRGGSPAGRYPANLALDEEAAAILDGQSGVLTSGANPERRSSDKTRGVYGDFAGRECLPARGSDSGGASRFFYCAKASRSERGNGNNHPTVKPLDLCRWLATLLLPADSVKPRRLLVPFSGSGSEIIGAMQSGWDEIVGVEKDEGYCKIAEARIMAEKAKPQQLSLVGAYA